jgi:hypothetical protein
MRKQMHAAENSQRYNPMTLDKSYGKHTLKTTSKTSTKARRRERRTKKTKSSPLLKSTTNGLYTSNKPKKSKQLIHAT